MEIINKAKERDNFTIIPNESIRNKGLTWQATGLLCYLLSLPLQANIIRDNLTPVKKNGRTSMRNAFNELIQYKYIYRHDYLEKNNLKRTTYYVFSRPYNENQIKEIVDCRSAIKRPSEKKKAENAPSSNIYITNTDNSNNSISSDCTKKDEIECSQTEATASASSHDIYYSKEEDKFRNITQHDLDDWKTIYPYVDFKKEITKAKEWLKSNPSKARKKNWRKFLYNWFSSANETLERKAVYKSNSKSSGSSTTEDSQKQELKKIWPMYQRYKNWYEKLQDIAKINIGYLVIEGNHYYNSKNPYHKNIVNAESIKNELLDVYRVPIQVLKG